MLKIYPGTKRDLFGGNSTMDPVTGALIRSWKEGPNVKVRLPTQLPRYRYTNTGPSTRGSFP